MRTLCKLFFCLGLIFAAQSAVADQALAMRSGCMGCHKADQKLVGPAFKDVAAKYAGQAGIVDTLAARVKSGSAGGNWGDVAMPPSPAPEADVKKVVAWVMTLK
jgi:cytochrome c